MSRKRNVYLPLFIIYGYSIIQPNILTELNSNYQTISLPKQHVLVSYNPDSDGHYNKGE